MKPPKNALDAYVSEINKCKEFLALVPCPFCKSDRERTCTPNKLADRVDVRCRDCQTTWTNVVDFEKMIIVELEFPR